MNSIYKRYMDSLDTESSRFFDYDSLSDFLYESYVSTSPLENITINLYFQKLDELA